MNKIKTYSFRAVTIAVLLTTPVLLANCSSKKTTETTTTTEVAHPHSHHYDADGNLLHDSSKVEVTKTESKTSEVSDSDSGTGLFGIIGNIIALPFRAVGALLSAIF